MYGPRRVSSISKGGQPHGWLFERGYREDGTGRARWCRGHTSKFLPGRAPLPGEFPACSGGFLVEGSGHEDAFFIDANLDALRGLSLSVRRRPFPGQFLQEWRQAVQIGGGMAIFFAEIEVIAKPFKVLAAVIEGDASGFHPLGKDPGDVIGDIFHKISGKLPFYEIKQDSQLEDTKIFLKVK
jgi:hypothetical protein